MEIRVAEPSSGSDWNAFVAATPGGTFYHLHEWAQINRSCFGHRAFMLEGVRDGRVSGVLPLTLVSSLPFGRILCSMPFVNYAGPCSVDAGVAKALANEASELARRHNARFLELRCAAPLETELEVSTRKISMTIHLEADPEKLWNGFSSKHRTNIRRSYKNELTVTNGSLDLLDTFHAVMEQSWRDLGTPLYARSYFERILRTFPEQTRIFICRRGEEPIAAAFNGYFGDTVEGMWAGGTSAARPLQANYVLYWEMLQDACRRGFKHYHLGRSTADSGAEDFKKKWNADTRQLYWYTYRPDGRPPSELNVDNPKYRLAIATWRKLPIWATRLLGPMISRGIP